MGRGVTGGTTAVHGRLVWRILGRGVEALCAISTSDVKLVAFVEVFLVLCAIRTTQQAASSFLFLVPSARCEFGLRVRIALNRS